MKVIEVAIPAPLNKTFHYLPAQNMQARDIAGKRVKVSFHNRTVTAYALSAAESDENRFKLKPVLEVIDDEPVITEEAKALAAYISANYVCSLGEAMASVIPVSMKAPKRISKKLSLNEDDAYYDIRHNLNAGQRRAADLINLGISKEEIKNFLVYGITASGKTEVYLNCIEQSTKIGRASCRERV